MTAGWVGVASRDHVHTAVDGGFCQLNHGKLAPLQRLHPGDAILYYAPRDHMRAGTVVQAFVAIGRILPGEPWQVEVPGGFQPYRRAVRYYHGHPAPIHPLLQTLSFTRDRTSWGQMFRRGTFRIEPDDVQAIAAAMGVKLGEGQEVSESIEGETA